MLLLTIAFTTRAQQPPRPKLVVGIVIDQMRWDYLYRFASRYTDGGFMRLLNGGFRCENTFIPYTPTYTAAGHASIYTGSVPALNGMMGNNWYDRQKKKVVYCTDDSSVRAVGSSSAAGRMSPRNLWANTITDELRLASNFRNKTISIALKDRGSILPGGHASNGSYWLDNATGGWISSTFYMQELPDWIKKVNEKHYPDSALKRGWETLFPLGSYVQSSIDSNAYEGRVPGEGGFFPHRTDTIKTNAYESFRYMPAAASFTLETAKAAIDGERLGGRGLTDFLTVSISSTDYIGHSFGPASIEVEDTYLRLDRDLRDFFLFLDKKIGKGQYLLFLTADHAAAHNPQFLRDNHLPTGDFKSSTLLARLNDSLEKKFGSRKLIENYINYQLYLNADLIRSLDLSASQIKIFISEQLIRMPGVSAAVDLVNLPSVTLPAQVKMMLTNGYNHRLSGDIQIILQPQWFDRWATGTTHGQWNPYDAHIPLLFYGWGIKKGSTAREVYMTDIAPTLAALLHIQMPSACVGKAVVEVTK